MEILLACVRAFLVGGAFCVLAQVLIDYTKLTPARILVIYVCFGVFLGAVGLYAPIREFAGAGIGVLLIGFGGNVALGVKEAVDAQGIIGALTGGLGAAAGGTAAALCFGYLFALIFRGKPKKL